MLNFITLAILSITIFSCGGPSESGSDSLISPNTVNNSSNTTTLRIQNINISPATYLTDDILDIVITWNKNAFVADGTPSIDINIGGVVKNASYISGSGTAIHHFALQITSGDNDYDGVTLISPIKLNSATLQDNNNKNASLGFTQLQFNSVKVDTFATELVINSNSAYTNSLNVNLSINANFAEQMYLSTSSCESGGSWENFVTSKNFDLAYTNSENTIFLQIVDSNGNKSSCVSQTIVHDNLVPNAPSNVIAANNASDIASDATEWTSALDNGLAGISHYEYAIATSNSSNDIIPGGSWVSTSQNTEYQITSGISLTGGVDYYTLIRSIDNAGNASNIAYSSAWNIIVSPEKITALEASNRAIDSITIAWGYPIDNGTAITDYQIQYKISSNTDWININDGISTTTNYQIASLIAETEYDFRVRAFNGINYSAWSNILQAQTLPNIAFFAQPYKAINVGGSTDSTLVAIQDGVNFTIKDVSTSTESTLSLNRGETHRFTSEEFDVIVADGPFYVAGRAGSGSAQNKGNITWSTSAWVGNEFYFNFNRNSPMNVKVFAFTEATVTITQGGVFVASQVISEDQGYTFSITSYGSYELNSTGLIMAYHYSNAYADPKPLLPASTDIIGFPSSSAKITSSSNGNNINYIHSNSVSSNINVDTGNVATINPQGTSSLYQSSSLRLLSEEPIVANSYADSNGYCSAPFVPVSMLKKKFATNVSSDYVAFASDRPVTITIYYSNGQTSTLALTRSGTNNKAPYVGRLGLTAAGTVFLSDDVFQAWYQPNSDVGGADEDETIMFGWN